MREKIYLVKEKRKGRSPYYQVIYFRKGKKTSKSTGTTRKSEALVFLSEFKKNLEKKEVIPEIKLSKYKEQYKEFMSRSFSYSYIRSIDLSFRMLIEFTGDIYLSELTRARAEDFISITFRRTKHAAKLYNRTLKAAFNKAVENWEYIKVNPFQKIKIPRIPEKLPIFITESEFRMILDKTTLEIMRDIFTVAFYTGLRLGEITHMTWGNIDFKRNQITVRNTEIFITKSKKERIIPMYKDVREILKKREKNKREEKHPVFSKVLGIRLNGDYISKYFKKALIDSELKEKGIHFHSLRHSFASNLIRRGVPIMVVKELMGHQDISTTQIYAHVRRKDLIKAVKKFSKMKGFEND